MVTVAGAAASSSDPNNTPLLIGIFAALIVLILLMILGLVLYFCHYRTLIRGSATRSPIISAHVNDGTSSSGDAGSGAGAGATVYGMSRFVNRTPEPDNSNTEIDKLL